MSSFLVAALFKVWDRSPQVGIFYCRNKLLLRYYQHPNPILGFHNGYLVEILSPISFVWMIRLRFQPFQLNVHVELR